MYKIKNSKGEILFEGTLGYCRRLVLDHREELLQPGKYFPESYKLRWDVYDSKNKLVEIVKR